MDPFITGCFTSDSFCRNESSTLEKYLAKIGTFLTTHSFILDAINKGYKLKDNGFDDKALCKYKIAENVLFFTDLLIVMEINRELYKAYSCTYCNDIDNINSDYWTKYNILKLIECFVCKDIPMPAIHALLQDLGWVLSPLDQMTGIGYMCIRADDAEYKETVCSCDNKTFTIK